MKELLVEIKNRIKTNYGSFIVILCSILLLLSYYVIPYKRTIYQIICIISLFGPFVFDIINKINFDNKEQNYFKITNFTTSRLYLLLLLPLFVNIYTNWYMLNDILSHQSLAYFSVYLVTNAVVNIFVIKYTLNKKRNSDLDQNINVIIYIIILGLLLLAR